MFGQWMGDNRIDLKLERREHQMTDKQKEAIGTLFHLEHINGYVDLYEKHDVIIKSDILLKWKNATKEALNLIQTQQAEIEKSRNTKDLYYENKELRKLLEKKDKIIDEIQKEVRDHIGFENRLKRDNKEPDLFNQGRFYVANNINNILKGKVENGN